jgi:hypothetical protein
LKLQGRSSLFDVWSGFPECSMSTSFSKAVVIPTQTIPEHAGLLAQITAVRRKCMSKAASHISFMFMEQQTALLSFSGKMYPYSF